MSAVAGARASHLVWTVTRTVTRTATGTIARAVAGAAACAIAWTATLLAFGCADANADRGPTRIYASASLARAFEDLAAAYESQRPGARIELHTAGTPRLVVQLREGAPGALLAAADHASVEQVFEAGRAVGTPQVLATNRLAVVSSDATIRALEDLGREGLTVLMCGPQVPAGRYARAALDAAGVAVTPVSDEPSVSAVVTKVLLGEANAGLVYATDAVAVGDALHSFELVHEGAPTVEYPFVLLDGSKGDDHARGFAEFLRSDAGRAVLTSHGFGVEPNRDPARAAASAAATPDEPLPGAERETDR